MPDEMLSLVQTLCDAFPFRSGLAGFSFERSHYAEQVSETHAWRTSMRHPGIDIVRIPVDAKAPGTDAVKGIGWLTMLATDLVAQLGGLDSVRSKLDPEIELIDCKYGVIVKAGPVPLIGDVNRGDRLPLYRQVYQLLAPWIAVASKRSMSFQLVDDFVKRTEAWYARLDA